MSLRLSGGFRIKPLGVSINPNANISRGRNRSFLNGNIVSSNTRSLNLGTSLNYAVGSDLQLNNRISYTRRQVAYMYNDLADQNFTTVSNNLSLNVSLPYDLRFTLSSNLIYNANVALGANNTTIHMANVSMEKLFLKKALSLKASVSDVFNNSRNTSRYASDTYILESVNMGMRRYFLMSLSYRIRKFGEKAAAPGNNLINRIMIF
ncbi:Outer membrane protein beta-barrel family protein [compost metagenome]